jgi:hypothetical protein
LAVHPGSLQGLHHPDTNNQSTHQRTSGVDGSAPALAPALTTIDAATNTAVLNMIQVPVAREESCNERQMRF